MKYSLAIVLVLALFGAALADTYMQGMHGSNCRNREKAQDRTNANRCFNTQNNAAGGYGIHVERLVLYAGTTVMLDWTVQHGAGRGEQKADFIIQALWAEDQGALGATVRDNELGGNGQDTARIADDATALTLSAYETAVDAAGNSDRCRYESAKSFWYCSQRSRNLGLFTGNNTPAGNTAQSTRQNDNNLHGLECGEEREYYPYWAPTDFRDIVAYKHNVSLCAEVTSGSQNVAAKYLCVGSGNPGENEPENAITAEECTGQWQATPAWGIDEPECLPVFLSRINHLGNVADENVPQFARYNWTLPAKTGLMQVRQRYNISVDELPHDADASDDGNALLQANNPLADVGENIQLQLTFNTAQIFRTFQDRSSLAEVKALPTGLNCGKIHVVKTRGGRGNIVQAYPGTEYDFAPDKLFMEYGDCLHMTWSGTDAWTANDEGQGDDEDHHNYVGMASLSALHPITFSQATFPDVGAFGGVAADRLAWLKKAATGCSTQDPFTDTQLDDVPYACDLGIIGPFNTAYTAYGFCTRNTNFSNRSQKFAVEIGSGASAATTAGVIVGGFIMVAGVVAAGSMFYAKSHPNSAVARVFQNGGSRGSGILSSTGSQGRGSRGGGLSRGGSHGSRNGRSSRSGSRGGSRGSKGGKSRSSSKGSGWARK